MGDSLDQEALARLRAAIARDTDPMVVLGMQEGVRLADDLIDNSPILANAIGKDLRGHIRRAGVMWRINDLCARGDLPFKTQITSMPIGSWHWLEIIAPGVRAHICRTDDANAFPTDTPNRQDARLVNPQFDLFSETVVPFREILEQVDTMYAWLSYGTIAAGDLTHICWGVPASDANDWLAWENLLQGRGTGDAPIPPPAPPPAPDPTTRLRFHRHIEKALDENDKDKDQNA
jgi:hypothetical protein